MKAQIRVKTRNRGHDWAVFHRPNKKKAVGGLIGFMLEMLSWPPHIAARWMDRHPSEVGGMIPSLIKKRGVLNQ
jgi:hypothetical protein